MVDLSELNEVSSDTLWLKPLFIGTDKSELFVAQDNGVIFRVRTDTPDSQKSILRLPQTLNNQDFISLSSMIQHPSFSKLDEPGYGVIFTAHTIQFNRDAKVNRLTPSGTDIDLTFIFQFETIITAWEYDFEKQMIDPQSQREVLRIPINHQDNAINNLTFDPYQKLWNADYGQLHFSLNALSELQQYPLYSGAIFRVHPLVFGARNYTVSKTNPFNKVPAINNEIVFLNAQNIDNFFWAKSEHGSIFVQHHSQQFSSLSKVKIGDDLQKQLPDSLLWQQPNTMPSMLLYQGRNLLNLRNNMIFFTLIDSLWHLSSRELALLDIEPQEYNAEIESNTLSLNSQLQIFEDAQGEVLVIENQTNRMYLLHASHSNVPENSTSNQNLPMVQSDNNLLYSILGVIAATLIFFVYRIKSGRQSSHNLIDNEFVRFKFDPIMQCVLLFRPHQKNRHTSIGLDDIVCCEILLNSHSINTVNDQLENAFSNKVEADLRLLFKTELSNKMSDDDSRHVELLLSDKNGTYPVSLYLRKGNSRVTSSKYNEVIGVLIDLCWIISKHINPTGTEARLVTKRPAITPSFATIPKQSTKAKAGKSEHQTSPEPALPELAKSNPPEQGEPQSEVIDALDKLVNLHQKGYLSDQEFNAAKSKVLQNLLGN